MLADNLSEFLSVYAPTIENPATRTLNQIWGLTQGLRSGFSPSQYSTERITSSRSSDVNRAGLYGDRTRHSQGCGGRVLPGWAGIDSERINGG